MKVCSTENLAEKIRFQQQEIEKLKAEILEADNHSLKKYIATFNREYMDFKRLSSFEDLYCAALGTDIIYLGDYHALPACQEFQADFIDNLARQHPRLTIAIEMLYGRNQAALDAWMRGEITEYTFLKRVRYHREWGYNWASYRKIFEIAQRHHISITAIDCEPRNALRMIHRRDTYAAQKIVSLLKTSPDHKLIVIFGESHLASKHLPYRVNKLLRKDKLRKREMTVFQNIDNIYWNLACRGFEEKKVVEIRRHKFCVFTATPFIKYESYRQLLERWKSHRMDEDENTYLTSTVYNLIDTILSFIQIDKYDYCLVRYGRCIEFMADAYPEVYSAEDTDLLAALLTSGHLGRSEQQQITYHLRHQGSCYIPSINAIYIEKLNLMHAAEQAAHFIHAICKGGRLPRNGGPVRRIDAFYERIIEEALGYFASKLIDPSRDQLRTNSFAGAQPAAQPTIKQPTELSVDEFEQVRKLIHTHKALERAPQTGDRAWQAISCAVRPGGKKYTIITHELGYILGEQLYRGYLRGEFSREEIAGLFLARRERQKTSVQTYFNLAARVTQLIE
jgi:uncharacterized iron-regulated protein